MTLSCDSPYNRNSYGPGVYINEVTIAEVQDMAGQTLPFFDRPFDIGFKLMLDIGRDFQPELVIAGNFKRHPISDEVIGWGNAFVVQEALTRLGFKGDLDPNNVIPAHIFSALIGKKFLRLSYVSGVKENGKFRYTDWNNIATVEEGAESLSHRFKRSLTKGYPRNYHPDLLERVESDVTFPPVTEEEPF